MANKGRFFMESAFILLLSKKLVIYIRVLILFKNHTEFYRHLDNLIENLYITY